jgi:hypothetical protein
MHGNGACLQRTCHAGGSGATCTVRSGNVFAN